MGPPPRTRTFIRDLNLNQLREVRIYSELATLRSLLGSCRIGGLVVIDMLDPRFQVPLELALPSLRIPAVQRPIEYPIQGSPDLPRIQELVYWSPYDEVENQDSYHVEFVAPDLSGRYLMEGVIQDRNGTLYRYHIPLIKSQEGWQVE